MGEMNGQNGRADGVVTGTVRAVEQQRTEAIHQAVGTVSEEGTTMVVHTAQVQTHTAQQALEPPLSPPDDNTTRYLWVIVVVAFAIVLVGSFLTLAMSVFLPHTEATLQMMLTVFTSVVGFLGGLFTPSPISSGTRK